MVSIADPRDDGPDIDKPEIDTPDIDKPEIDTPVIDKPEIGTPEIDGPEVDTPEVDTPEVDTPEVNTPDIEGGVDRRARDGIAGLYGPASEAWRLNREALLLLGAGPRALLMQIAHPLVAEGVDQHSNFRADPWSRLVATLHSYLTIVYGSGPQARAEIARLNRLHRSIAGPVRDERARAATSATAYLARDPELSLWVHATLIDATIVAYDAWIEPLSRDRRRAYYDETRPIGRAFGISDRLLPSDLDAFEAYLARMTGPGGPVVVTPTAQSLAQVILHPSLAPIAPPLAPILRHVPAWTYDWTMWPAVALLPAEMRDAFGLPWSPLHRGIAAWLLGGWQLWRPILPVRARLFSAALAAERLSGTAQ
jgi:uncharacterized protein (DUF2236 family)